VGYFWCFTLFFFGVFFRGCLVGWFYWYLFCIWFLLFVVVLCL
jgi:hypothetical protein